MNLLYWKNVHAHWMYNGHKYFWKCSNYIFKIFRPIYKYFDPCSFKMKKKCLNPTDRPYFFFQQVTVNTNFFLSYFSYTYMQSNYVFMIYNVFVNILQYSIFLFVSIECLFSNRKCLFPNMLMIASKKCFIDFFSAWDIQPEISENKKH